MRNHMIVPDVGQRDSAYFSVIDSEWPAVRANLRRRLAGSIRSRVSSTAARAKIGVKTMLEAASPIQVEKNDSPSEVVDAVLGELADQVADELDRGEDEEDQPEVAADQAGAAAQGLAHAAALELDHRPGQPEPDEDEDAGDEEEQQADDHQADVDNVDQDQAAVVEPLRDFERSRGLSPVRVGEGDGDGAAVEDLAEQAGDRDRRRRQRIAAICRPLSKSIESTSATVTSASRKLSGMKTAAASSSSEGPFDK